MKSHLHPRHVPLPADQQPTAEGAASAEAYYAAYPLATPFSVASSLSLTSSLPLPNSAARIPVLGLGVWASPNHVTPATVRTALRLGYRHVDTAQVYGNEAEVGAGLRDAGVPRSEVFVTTKINHCSGDAERDYRSCLRSLEEIDAGEEGRPGYVDLFLIHRASVGAKGRKALWGVMERLLREGRAKSIGVSNWTGQHIDELKESATVWPPMVNQIELHPWCQQRAVVAYCQAHGIVVAAYSPLVRMERRDDPTLKRIAEHVGKSTAQVLIRYCLQNGWVPLPKSDREERIKGNADVFDWELDDAEMTALDQLGRGGDDGIVVDLENLDERR